MAATNVSRSGEELSRQLKSQLLPVTVLISVETCVGFFGNIAILLVYAKQNRQVNFRCFVLALAFVDLISCCTILPGEVFSQLNWYNYKYTWVCKVKSFFNGYTAWASASVLLILGIDRYRKVCHPCKWQIRFQVAYWLCVFCLVISAVVASPVLLFWGTQSFTYEFKGENFTVSVCEKSSDYAGTVYPILIVTGVLIGPGAVMIVVTMALNCMIALRLFCHRSTKSVSAKQCMNAMNCNEVSTRTNRQYQIDSSNIDINESKPTEKPILNSSSHVIGLSKNQFTASKKNAPKRILPEKELSADKTNSDEEFTDDFTSWFITTDQALSGNKNRNLLRTKRSRNPQEPSGFHRKHKTMIMLILTSIFSVTMATYIILTLFVAKPNSILKEMSDTDKTVFFFFWRLHYVNSIVNPILYGFMDPGFRSGFMRFVQKCKKLS